MFLAFAVSSGFVYCVDLLFQEQALLFAFFRRCNQKDYCATGYVASHAGVFRGAQRLRGRLQVLRFLTFFARRHYNCSFRLGMGWEGLEFFILSDDTQILLVLTGALVNILLSCLQSTRLFYPVSLRSLFCHS